MGKILKTTKHACVRNTAQDLEILEKNSLLKNRYIDMKGHKNIASQCIRKISLRNTTKEEKYARIERGSMQYSTNSNKCNDNYHILKV